MSIRVSLESTKIILTEVGKKWFMEHYPKGIVYEYDENGEFTLNSMVVVDEKAIVQIICPLGIPYIIPANIDGQIIPANIDGQTTFRVVYRAR